MFICFPFHPWKPQDSSARNVDDGTEIIVDGQSLADVRGGDLSTTIPNIKEMVFWIDSIESQLDSVCYCRDYGRSNIDTIIERHKVSVTA